MENKQNLVITRKPLEKGKFTQVSHEVLRNTKLTPTARLVLIEILSNTEDFIMNQNILMKRVGIREKGLRAAFKNLEENNYLKRVISNRGHIYHIDENGKLNETKVKQLPTPIPTKKEQKEAGVIDGTQPIKGDVTIKLDNGTEVLILAENVPSWNELRVSKKKKLLSRTTQTTFDSGFDIEIEDLINV